jgi:hypothetical protein
VEVRERDERLRDAVRRVAAAVPSTWRRGEVERADLSRFAFAPEDVVLVVGQDGLVANVAKYVGTQVVVGIDPEPGRNAGVLVMHRPQETADLLRAVVRGSARVQSRAMVSATLDNGESLDALNEVFVGHPSHQSARYRIGAAGVVESQSSSGLIAATGTGATGWAASIHRERHGGVELPGVGDRALAWFVREAWPSPSTATSLTAGRLVDGDALTVVVESDALVVFGDGLEADRLTATWGQAITLALADRTLQLF